VNRKNAVWQRRVPETSKENLDGKVALVSGAGQGIGRAIAHALAAEGCKIVLVGRNLAKLRAVERELRRYKARTLSVVCDVRDPRAIKVLQSAVKKHFSQVDILVNNAGVAHANLAVARLPAAAWQEVIDTNLTGMFMVTQAMLPLTRRGGTIVNNLSIAAKRVFPGSSAYAASKHGALGFTNTLREELRPRGIRVIALLAGATDTAIWNAFWPSAPRKKMMSPETIARLVVHAVRLPANAAVEELTVLPAAGTL